MRSGHQSRKGALFEVCANTATGFVLSYLTWLFVVKPIWAIDTTHADNLAITCVFTVVSIVRSYFWRRLMTKVHHEEIDTSDIPEADEEFFRTARVVLPEESTGGTP